jgi:hypothetical protein
MLNPERLLRLFIEIIFVLLGGLVVWLGVTNHIFFDRRKPAWLIVSLALVLWGIRALYKPAKSWSRGENWTRGISLALLGAVMLAISRVPFVYVGPLLAIGGGLLALRGILGSMLVFRTR